MTTPNSTKVLGEYLTTAVDRRDAATRVLNQALTIALDIDNTRQCLVYAGASHKICLFDLELGLHDCIYLYEVALGRSSPRTTLFKTNSMDSGVYLCREGRINYSFNYTPIPVWRFAGAFAAAINNFLNAPM